MAATLGGLLSRKEHVREGFRVGGEVLGAADPHVERLTQEYGVPPDVPESQR
jgi:hypothetical protein